MGEVTRGRGLRTPRKEDRGSERSLSRSTSQERAWKDVAPASTRSSKGYTGYSEWERRDWPHSARTPGRPSTGKTPQGSEIESIGSGTHIGVSSLPQC